MSEFVGRINCLKKYGLSSLLTDKFKVTLVIINVDDC